MKHLAAIQLINATIGDKQRSIEGREKAVKRLKAEIKEFEIEIACLKETISNLDINQQSQP